MRLLPAFALALLVANPSARGQEASPSDVAGLVERAVARHRSGDVEGAVALYEQALAAGAESPGLRSNLGAAYAGLGRYDDAVEQYTRALAADPTNVAIRRNLALAYYKAGRIADAAAETERVVGAQPDNEAAVLLLADCRFRLGENARVIEILEPLAGRAAPDRAVSYLLGMALVAEGRMGEAQQPSIGCCGTTPPRPTPCSPRCT